MSEDNRMRHARESTKLILTSLGPRDSLALINYYNQHALAGYNVACMSGLFKDPDMVVKYLKQLATINNSVSQSRLEKAKTDSDFNLIRQEEVFADFMRSL